MFPRPSAVPVGVALILAEHLNVGGNQSVLPVGTQTHIDIKQNAGACLQREPSQHPFDELHIVALRLRSIVVVEKYQVKIRRVTELFAAKFSIADYRKLRVFAMPRCNGIPGKFNHHRQHSIGQSR